ncbi:hypothetical protein WMF04_28690 [Sorangium sp. So ce260]|uniref:hypothetical protein n=1 Tax=Sorangium sp. So ce260 TaxID=3133291 RepID=UPI003F61CF89
MKVIPRLPHDRPPDARWQPGSGAASQLADAQGTELHLTTGQSWASGNGAAASAGEVADAIDGEPRRGAHDLGADELTAP